MRNQRKTTDRLVRSASTLEEGKESPVVAGDYYVARRGPRKHARPTATATPPPLPSPLAWPAAPPHTATEGVAPRPRLYPFPKEENAATCRTPSTGFRLHGSDRYYTVARRPGRPGDRFPVSWDRRAPGAGARACNRLTCSICTI